MSEAPAEKVDLQDFISIYNLQNGFTMPAVHAAMCAWLVQTEGSTRLLFAWRECGKSHLIALWIAYKLYVDPNYTCVIVSATQKIARKTALFVRSVIETHPLTKSLVPERGSDLWQKTTFTVKRSKTLRNPSVEVTSLESGITGLHGDELIADDIETSDNITTPDARANIRDREKEFGQIATKQITYVGTPHTSDSIYKDILSREGIKFGKFPALIDDEYVWPEKAEELERKRVNMTLSWWNTQYQLEFDDAHDTVLPVKYIRSYSGEPTYDLVTGKLESIEGATIIDACAAWDAAQGREGTDDSVLSIAFRTQDGRSYLHRAIKLPPISADKGWEPQAMMIVKHLQELRVGKIYVEENFNRALSSDLKRAANEAHVRIQIIGFSSIQNKAQRIGNVLEPIMSGGRLWVHKSVDSTPFRDQASDFPRSVTNKRSKDDFIDAAAMAISNLKGGSTSYDRDGKFIGGPSHRPERSQLMKPDRPIGVTALARVGRRGPPSHWKSRITINNTDPYNNRRG